MRASLYFIPSAAALLAAMPAIGQETAEPAEKVEATVVVIGGRENLLSISGSGATIEAEDLTAARVLTVNEALRQVAGVYPRDEEGIGLRPNIGVRGLSPTRSSEVLLLEDGLPLTYAPYGDNASYSHPPLRRFERIEVLKGASQIRFGPHTVGGVVNYISPSAPEEFEGDLQLAGGNRGYVEASGSLGGSAGGFRLLGHAAHTEFEGVRDNTSLDFNDYHLRVERTLTPNQELTARVGYFAEDSQVTYSGLTAAEYAADPRGNVFANDTFDTERFTASATHAWQIAPDATLTTSAYSLWFDRDWWRQSSNSGQRPNDSSDPACGGLINLNTTCGNEGRLREYNQYGIESRLDWSMSLLGAPAEIEAGLRYHEERQRRLQINADTPLGRTPGTGVNGGVRENNTRYASAISGFVTAGIEFGSLRISPGVRIESIEFERVNVQTGQSGTTDQTEVIPGLGFTYLLREDLAIYGGVHRGYSPPRVEDIITNAGGSVDLDPEESVNWEAGIRGTLRPGLDIDAGLFRLDFENQIVPASVAGGVGATLTSAGKTEHTGLEASLRASLRDMSLITGPNDIYFRTALTWLESAEFKGARFSSVSGFNTVSVTGNRLPYAPEFIGSFTLGYKHGDWLNVQGELQHTGEMFTDDLNTIAPIANGQRGRIDSASVLNLAVNVTPGGGNVTYFVTAKNVADELYIVDRSRGIIPGAPRLWQAGLALAF